MSINKNFIVEPDGLSNEQQKVIDELIEYFKGQSTSNLELLTTAIYAYNHLENKSQENIIRGVQKIKSSKYSREQILSVLEEFQYYDKEISC